MLTASIVVLGVSAVAAVALAAVVLAQKPEGSAHRHFFMFAVGVAGWALSNALFIEGFDEPTLFGIALVSYGFAAVVALGFFLFCHDLANTKYHPVVLRGAKWVGAITAIMSMIPSVVAYGVSGLAIETHTVGLALYGIVLVSFFGAGLGLLVRTVITTRNAAIKRRIQIILLGLSLAAIVGVGCNLILPLLGNYSFVHFGPMGSLLLMMACAYAIVRHGLFDVKFAAARATTYTLTLGLLAVLYVAVAEGVSRWLTAGQAASEDVSLIDVAITLGLVFFFQPVKRFFDRLTNRIFYRNRYSRDEFYAELSGVLAGTTNLRPLLERTSRLFVKTFSTAQASFFVYRNEERYMTAGSTGYTRLSMKDAQWLDGVVQSRAQNEVPLIITELQDTTEDIAVRRLMVSYQLAVVLPLLQGSEVVGYLCLGEQKSGRYNARDRRVLRTVADEIAIAIQNALSMQEVRDLNETLQQRIEDATRELRLSNAQLRKLDEAKDEFISMASHQLRTPLTSIKGYIDMMLEGDAGKITSMQQKFLTEAFVSSERMVHLINDFLSISRLQTGKFIIEKRPTNLTKVVEQELESLKVTASGRDLSFSFTSDKDIPHLMLDEPKIRQVIMNFSDNSLYYSPAGNVINVSLTVEGSDVLFTITDKGIGVPKAEQARLFTKFFRAANARKQRPDGTGVGLYLAKRIITEHGGKIVFESVEGKGSTFGFRLPLLRLRADKDTN